MELPMSDHKGELEGQVAVVTGGASGIGRATAIALAEQGVRVFTGDVAQPEENSELSTDWGIVERHCDVCREQDVRELMDAAAAVSGSVDILVNSAGVALSKPIPEVTEQEWDWCLNTNLRGVFFCCKHVIPRMRGKGGTIVNISSNAGLLPRWHDPVYSISKAALVALTRSLALSHAPDRIRVNAICPGPVEATGMMNANFADSEDPEALRRELIEASPLARALGRMIGPAEVAQSVLYLVSPASVMVSGTAIAIDGGKSLGVPPP